jgi:hypothetical protein
MTTIVHDGALTQDEALDALQQAAQAATEALPDALAKCSSDAERTQVMNDRDTVVVAYLDALKKSLVNTSGMFEQVAGALRDEADAVRQRKQALVDGAQAIGLFGDLVKLAASLALAFA